MADDRAGGEGGAQRRVDGQLAAVREVVGPDEDSHLKVASRK